MENTNKIEYIDVTPTSTGCRIFAVGHLEGQEHPSFMVNHIPVPFSRVRLSDGMDLLWADFAFPAVHLKITQEDQVIAQVEQEELAWLAENAGLYLDVQDSEWNNTVLRLKGRVLSPYLSKVRLSVQDEWGRPMECEIIRSQDESLNDAGLNVDDQFEMHVAAKNAKELWLVMEDKHHLVRERLAMPAIMETDKSPLQKAKDLLANGWIPAYWKLKNHFSAKSRNESYHSWFERQKPDSFRLEKQRKTIFANPPKISLVVAAWNTPLNYFDEMVQSVLDQTYPNWQLCIADGSDNYTLLEHIQKNYSSERRITYKKLPKNLGISGNMNEAIRMASGDYIGFFDHDDLLTPDALYEAARVMEASKPDLIYTDEDKLNDQTKTFCEPHFKPDFNLDQLLCHNYITHLTFVSRPLLEKTGWLDSAMDGSQDYDFILRAVENAGKIHHIPKILYHWRMHPQSTAENSDSKDYCVKSGQLALTCFLNRNRISAQVHPLPKPYDGMYWMQPFFAGKPKISVITAFGDKGEELERLVQSLDESGWDNLEILAIDTRTQAGPHPEKIDQLVSEKKIRLLEKSAAGSFADHLNDAAQLASGDLLLFINPTARLLHPQSLAFMAFKALMKDHGAVTGKIMDAGHLVYAYGEIADGNGKVKRAFAHLDENHPGHMGRALAGSHFQMVPIDLMMVQTDRFMETGGFLPEFSAKGMAEDFCLRMENRGYKNAGAASAQIQIDKPWNRLVHLPAKTKGDFYEKWQHVLNQPDPAYNPNFDLVKETFVLPQ